MLSIDHSLLAASVLLLLGVLASKASGRLGVPALLLFLFLGMSFGMHAAGEGSMARDPVVAQGLGIIALCFILFSGALETPWKEIKPVILDGISLSTLGIAATASLVALLGMKLLGLSFLEGLLLGSIVSSTDAAAVFSVLRAKKVSFRGHVKPLLELESGINDPMAVFMTLGIIEILKNPSSLSWSLVPAFVMQMGVGALAGFILGHLKIFLVNRLHLEDEGLYPVVTFAFVLLIYAATSAMGGSGFLAVYIAGLVLGARNFKYKKSLIRFHSGIAWLMQIAMFLTLGLLVRPAQLVSIALLGSVFSAFLIFIARRFERIYRFISF